ncbi:MAG: hypothetical protein LWX56_02050 [Ignavibacteria bacterium]|nr:hypothetical protein [Ignavibacteria bacterium]
MLYHHVDIFIILALGVTFLWMLTPFRQVKTGYFYFFLCLSLMEVTTHIAKLAFHYSGNVWYMFFNYLILATLQPELLMKKQYRYWYILGGVILLALNFYILAFKEQLLIIALLQVIISLIIFTRFIKQLTLTGNLSVFLLILIASGLMDALKLFNLLLGTPLGLYYFYINQISSLIAGIIFCMFTDSHKWLNFKIHQHPPQIQA